MRDMDARKAEILDQIDAAHHQWDAIEFWPQQFVEGGFGTYGQVLEALEALAEDGYVRERVEVKSVYGESFYEGPRAGLPDPASVALKFYFAHGREPDTEGEDAEVMLAVFFVLSQASGGSLPDLDGEDVRYFGGLDASPLTLPSVREELEAEGPARTDRAYRRNPDRAREQGHGYGPKGGRRR